MRVLVWLAVAVIIAAVGSHLYLGWRQDECRKCEEWRDSQPPPAPNERRRNPCKTLCEP